MPNFQTGDLCGLGVVVERDRFVLEHHYPEQVARQIVTIGQAVEGLAAEELSRQLALKLDAVGAVSGDGFPPKFRHPLSILPPNSVHFQGRTLPIGSNLSAVDKILPLMIYSATN